MYVTKCPACGREPKIHVCMPHKDGIRRRMCMCPNYHSVIPTFPIHSNNFYFIFKGEGDNNAIFCLWNKAIERYEKNKDLLWHERDWSPWSDDSQLDLKHWF